MTLLTKPVKRETRSTVFSNTKYRPLIVGIEPAGRDEAMISVKLKGERDTYRVSVQSVYNLAIQAHNEQTDRLAKKYVKQGMKKRTAMAAAKRDMALALRSGFTR